MQRSRSACRLHVLFGTLSLAVLYNSLLCGGMASIQQASLQISIVTGIQNHDESEKLAECRPSTYVAQNANGCWSSLVLSVFDKSDKHCQPKCLAHMSSV